MQLKTIMSVAVLAVSSAALAQVTTQPRKPMPGNNMAMPMNSTMPDSTMPMNSATPDSTMLMNTEDETMMNDSSMPNSTTPPR